MITEKIESAKKEVEEIYAYLSDAVRETTREYTKVLDDIVAELDKDINLFTNSELWNFQVRLGIEAYRLGNIKEQGLLKESCAETLLKEGVAKAFTTATGTQEIKKQQSILDTVDKQALSMLYSSVASLLKTKCDEAHRLVNILQSIQISRAAEAKQFASPRSEQDRLTME